MEAQDFKVGVEMIFHARGKEPSDKLLMTWCKRIISYATANKASEQDVKNAILKYVDSESEWLVLGKFLSLISPSIDSLIKDEIQMIMDYANNCRTYESLPDIIKKTTMRIGGTYDFRNATNDFQREAYLKRYEAARLSDTKGIKAEKIRIDYTEVEKPEIEPSKLVLDEKLINARFDKLKNILSKDKK